MARTKNKDKAKFCRSLDWGFDVTWLDKTGMHRLDDERLAKVELSVRGTSDQYEGFMVTVLNKREGKVDQKFFRFDDYLSPALDDRQDAREDYPLRGNMCFKVHGANCGWDWYIAVPMETLPFTMAVDQYLDMFR